MDVAVPDVHRRRLGATARRDPLDLLLDDPADCPAADILTSGDGVTIGANVEHDFTVNGVVSRNKLSPVNFFGRVSYERTPFEICIDDGR